MPVIKGCDNSKMLKPSPLASILQRLLIISLCYLQPAKASDYTIHSSTLRLTYDPMTIGNNESLGLLGAHALFNVGKYSYVGISGFGAITGKRGGFLTGGYSAGLRLPLTEQLNTDLSIFLGGGGGGAAPQGGGLMIREQAGLEYLASHFQFGAGVSRIYFPNGKIDSTQPYLSLQFPFTPIYASGWDAGELSPLEFSQPLYDRQSSISLSYKRYRGGSLFHSTAHPFSSISTTGVEWQQNAHGGLYYSLSAYGACGGGADGYAEVMAGGGYKWTPSQGTHIGIALSLGSGGGGDVNTGGGALGALTLSVEQRLSKELFVSLQGGYSRALEGRFSGTVAGISFGTYHIAPVANGWESEAATLPYSPVRYRLRLIQQQYLNASSIPTYAPVEKKIDLTGLQIDMQTSHHLYITGQAMAAWRGGAGGYASGMMGGGFSLPISTTFEVNSELLVGAAGGGGVNVGNGLVLGGTFLVRAHITDSLDFEIGSGRITAYNGGLDTRHVSLAVAYRFTRPER